MNNKKCLFFAVTKPNALFRKFLSIYDGNKCCLNCFCNFQTDQILKKHEKFGTDHDYIDLEMLKKFKTLLNKLTNEMEEVAGNVRFCIWYFILSMTLTQ